MFCTATRNYPVKNQNGWVTHISKPEVKTRSPAVRMACTLIGGTGALFMFLADGLKYSTRTFHV
jgi:hypothetical protein